MLPQEALLIITLRDLVNAVIEARLRFEARHGDIDRAASFGLRDEGDAYHATFLRTPAEPANYDIVVDNPGPMLEADDAWPIFAYGTKKELLAVLAAFIDAKVITVRQPLTTNPA